MLCLSAWLKKKHVQQIWIIFIVFITINRQGTGQWINIQTNVQTERKTDNQSDRWTDLETHLMWGYRNTGKFQKAY